MDGKRRGKNMMSRVQLEVFHLNTPARASDIVVLAKVELEEMRLAGFDKGYAAGWDDATTAVNTDRSAVECEVARNLQSLAFTFQEARMHLLRGLKPLLTTMMGRLLPQMGQELLCERILETLLPKAEYILESPAHIHVNSKTRRALEGLLAKAKGLTLKVVEDPALSDGQVFIRFHDGEETLIDMDRAVSQIMTVVNSFFDQSLQERKHG
jgi:flagellar biosynthesis/type III secretory pathway protein FliH